MKVRPRKSAAKKSPAGLIVVVLAAIVAAAVGSWHCFLRPAPGSTVKAYPSAGPQSAQARSLGIIPVGSTLLGLRAGDRIPAQGRRVTTLSGKSTTIQLDAPLVLYPNAVVQRPIAVPFSPSIRNRPGASPEPAKRLWSFCTSRLTSVVG